MAERGRLFRAGIMLLGVGYAHAGARTGFMGFIGLVGLGDRGGRGRFGGRGLFIGVRAQRQANTADRNEQTTCLSNVLPRSADYEGSSHRQRDCSFAPARRGLWTGDSSDINFPLAR